MAMTGGFLLSDIPILTSDMTNVNMTDNMFEDEILLPYNNQSNPGNDSQITWNIAGTGNPDDVITGEPPAQTGGQGPPDYEVIIGLCILNSAVTLVGLAGNLLVIYVILSDRKMRRSVTNLFILNLAVADLMIMLLGVPELVQFAAGRGWLLGMALCKLQRYVLVTALYVSIMSLVAVCVERYIAIVHPIKAHIFCSRRRILVTISIIWPVALLMGLPTALFNRLLTHPKFPITVCTLMFPGASHQLYKLLFKVSECVLFFLGPVLAQIVLYAVIGKHLFIGTDSLHRKQTVQGQDGAHRHRDPDAIRARKGVVKMLITTVIIYFVSYAPAQVPLFYDIFASHPFKARLPFMGLVMTLAFVNSAANPIIYSLFSQNFRRKFAHVLCRSCQPPKRKYHVGSNAGESCTTVTPRGAVRFSSLRRTSATLMSEM